jgi:hypothetical protein
MNKLKNFFKNNLGFLSISLSFIIMGFAYLWQDRILHPMITWSQWQSWWQQSEIMKARAAQPRQTATAFNLAMLMNELTKAQLAQYLIELPKAYQYKMQTHIVLNFRELPFDAWAAWMQTMLNKYPHLHIEKLIIDRSSHFGCVNLQLDMRDLGLPQR